MSDALDNPIWAALNTRHARFALGAERVKRYPADIGPFVAVPSSGGRFDAELEELVAPGEAVDFVGHAPAFPPSWQLLETGNILQMMCPQPIALKTQAQWQELSEADRPDMLELTALGEQLYGQSAPAALPA